MSDDLERFKGILATIALQSPGLSVRDALVTALDVEDRLRTELPELLHEELPVPTDDTPVEDAAAWCRRQPSIMDELSHPTSGKIRAIKEARALSGMGLKGAKDAIEYMGDHLK